MPHHEVKASPLIRTIDALGNVDHCQAINTRLDTASLQNFQASYVVRRSRLAPEMARVVAQLAFGGAA